MAVVMLLFIQIGLAEGGFDKSEYAARRARLMEKIPNGVAVILGATTPVSDNQFFQNNDFYYLTGVDIPNAVLITDGKNKESSLFLTISEKEAQGEGISLDLVRKPKIVTGIEKACQA